jgi:hypothetical protein
MKFFVLILRKSLEIQRGKVCNSKSIDMVLMLFHDFISAVSRYHCDNYAKSFLKVAQEIML